MSAYDYELLLLKPAANDVGAPPPAAEEPVLDETSRIEDRCAA
jgi:hypothetical protein